MKFDGIFHLTLKISAVYKCILLEISLSYKSDVRPDVRGNEIVQNCPLLPPGTAAFWLVSNFDIFTEVFIWFAQQNRRPHMQFQLLVGRDLSHAFCELSQVIPSHPKLSRALLDTLRNRQPLNAS